MNSRRLRFGLYVPVGPVDQEVLRVQDLINSIEAYEPNVSFVCLLDDSPVDRSLDRICRVSPRCTVVSRVHPRQGIGGSWLGGGWVSNLIAAKWFATETDVDFVVKLDTDALIVAPFAERLAHFMASAADVGLVGVLGRTCNPVSPAYHAFSDVEGLLKLLLAGIPESISTGWLAQHPGGIELPRLGMWPADKLQTLVDIRRALGDALRNGYSLGQYVQGGAYAVSARLLRVLADVHDAHPLEYWLDLPVVEDVFMTIRACAAGLTIHEFAGNGGVFGVQAKGLAGTPESLLDSHYAIIHSVKDYDGNVEAETRAFFRERRERERY